MAPNNGNCILRKKRCLLVRSRFRLESLGMEHLLCTRVHLEQKRRTLNKQQQTFLPCVLPLCEVITAYHCDPRHRPRE